MYADFRKLYFFFRKLINCGRKGNYKFGLVYSYEVVLCCFCGHNGGRNDVVNDVPNIERIKEFIAVGYVLAHYSPFPCECSQTDLY